MKNFLRASAIPAVLLAALLAACTTPPTATTPGSKPAHTAAPSSLQQVRDAFNAGLYDDVIRIVATSDELSTGPVPAFVEALKLQAFSYCVSNHRRECQSTFSRILSIDPSFDLAPAERGHPMWGPAFRSAKAAASRARS
jgi:hypothetical protein